MDWEREESSERRSSRVWKRVVRVERNVVGSKSGFRKDERESGWGNGRVESVEEKEVLEGEGEM